MFRKLTNRQRTSPTTVMDNVPQTDCHVRGSDVVSALGADGSVWAGQAGVIQGHGFKRRKPSAVPFPIPLSSAIEPDGSVVPAITDTEVRFSANPIPGYMPTMAGAPAGPTEVTGHMGNVRHPEKQAVKLPGRREALGHQQRRYG